MKLITVISSNDVQRTVACEDINAQGRQTTIRDVCADPAVLAFFGVEQATTAIATINITKYFFIFHYSLFTIHYSLFTLHFSLFTIHFHLNFICFNSHSSHSSHCSWYQKCQVC